MTKPATMSEIDGFWSSCLGCEVGQLYNSMLNIVRCPSAGTTKELHLFCRGATCVLAVKDKPDVGGFDKEIAHIINGYHLEEIFNSNFWFERFGDLAGRIVGPAYVGYADDSDFHAYKSESVRLLGANDDSLIRNLAQACSKFEWEHSAIQFERKPIFGCFVSDKLVAAASYAIWGKRIVHIGVVTHPEYRSLGYGKSVVSAISEYALGKGLIPQYRTLISNTRSVGIAGSLGFQKYAETFAVILKDI